MSKRKIKAKHVMADIWAGMSDSELMQKYKLTFAGLDSLFRKLLSAGLITADDLTARYRDPEDVDFVDLTGRTRRRINKPSETTAIDTITERLGAVEESISEVEPLPEADTQVREWVRRGPDDPSAPVCRSQVMKGVVAQCELAARSASIVFLQGESGSGKDFLASYIHGLSDRSSQPFRCINCAAIPFALAESELFGHEPGAFTGAGHRKPGLLELAPGGTVLLNEIGELSLELQAKLLHFLDTNRFWRLGGRQEIAVDVRVIVATNKNLENAVHEGRFRADLFYRVNVLPIRIPPLRERMEDLPLLIKRLTTSICADLNLEKAPEVDAKTLCLLKSYNWPGNVRELRNRPQRALVNTQGRRIPFGFMFGETEDAGWQFELEFREEDNMNEFIRDVRRRLVLEALKRAEGRRQVAAELLGISRYALKRHMTNLGLMDE